jgi:hypothetical protein
MSASCHFAHAQARLQARYADLPAEADWQRLVAARDIATYLEEARAGALRHWVKGFSGESDYHDLERGLRAQLNDSVDLVVRLFPAPWQSAFDWWRWLPTLALLEHLALGHAMPLWVLHDERLVRLLDSEGEIDRSALRAAGADSLIDPRAIHRAGGIGALWHQQWVQRWPRCDTRAIARMHELATLFRTHLDAYRRSPPDRAWTVRQVLRERLRQLFHLRLLQPAAGFIYLGLITVDLERLRRALIDRLLFRAEIP